MASPEKSPVIEKKEGEETSVNHFIHDIGEQIEHAIGFGKPTADVSGIRILSIDLKKAEIGVDVLITNPNPIPIPLLDINYLVESGGRKLISGLIPGAGTISVHGSETMNIPITLIYDDIKDTFDDIKPGSIIPYRIEIGLNVDVPVIGKINLPLEKEGEIPVPYKPDVGLDKVEFDKFSFEETSAILHLKVENKNDFDLALNALECDIWLSDVNIGNAKMTVSSRIEKNGIRYAMKGKLEVDTPFGPMQMPFNREGGSTCLKKKNKEEGDGDDNEVKSTKYLVFGLVFLAMAMRMMKKKNM
ncbi:hypothetical protein SUGI_0237870 [Cryptomeria japonica]|nr:hypothetical protein SUGI_0237870 [Cryptomeria japonica]